MRRKSKAPPLSPTDPVPQDLGFGSRVSQEETLRLLNRDGSFNVTREGLRPLESLNLYHTLLRMGWARFLLSVFSLYAAINALFAAAFLLCGPDALVGSKASGWMNRFCEAFFFSVHTFTTVGYGSVYPQGWAANVLAALDVFCGLLGFAFATGLLFARFSRPTAKIRFSRKALIAPYRGITAFEFRVANARRNVLIEVAVQLVFSQVEDVNGRRLRKFYPMKLERTKVAFFPLQWIIVHPIDEESPIYERSERDLREAHAEFLILLTAIDETFSQTVHTRSSYRAEELVWGARFSDMFRYNEEGNLTVDLRLIDGFEAVPDSEPPPTAT